MNVPRPTTTASEPSPAPNTSAPGVSPEDQVPLKEKLAYGVGQIAGSLSGSMESGLLKPVFVATLGVSPALMGLLDGIYRIWDAVTDLAMGVVSDNTRTCWGRRRPYLVLGAVLCTLWMPLLWLFDRSWSLNTIILWMVVFQLGMFLFNTIYNVPYQCMLLEISPSTVERTNASAMRAYFGKVAGFLMGWVWWLTQLPIFNGEDGEPDIIRGAFWVTLAFGVIVLTTGLTAAAFCRERYYQTAKTQEKTPVLKNLKLTFQNRPFVRLVAVAGLFMLGTYVADSLAFFVRLYYVCGGDQKLAATLTGVATTVVLIAGLAAIPLSQWAARRHGKRATMMGIMALYLIAGLSSWFTFNPAYPWLTLVNSVFTSIAGTAIWVILPSMTGDVVDYDELQTRERREGSFASSFSWMLKFSWSAAAALAGVLVTFTGLNTQLKTEQPAQVLLTMRLLLIAVPVLFLGAALWVIARFPLSTERMVEIRKELEARRGKL